MTSSDFCAKGDHITFHGFEFKFDRPIHPMSRIAAQFEGKKIARNVYSVWKKYMTKTGFYSSNSIMSFWRRKKNFTFVENTYSRLAWLYELGIGLKIWWFVKEKSLTTLCRSDSSFALKPRGSLSKLLEILFLYVDGREVCCIRFHNTEGYCYTRSFNKACIKYMFHKSCVACAVVL